MKSLEMDLTTWGWNHTHWESLFRATASEGARPGRILSEHKGKYRLGSEKGEIWAEVAGKFYQSVRRSDFPVTGDFVTARLPEGDGPAIIQAVLPRKTAFVRKAAGDKVEEQVVAANVDSVFLVSALDHDFNVRRLERYLTLAWESGSQPVIVLSKADLCDNVQARVDEVNAIAAAVPVHPISTQTHRGLDALAPHLEKGHTVGVLGSSGVGKSTLLNHLLGREAQATHAVRSTDSRGRHTTTHRELFVLPSGALMLDTPGMRELQLWTVDQGLEATFRDIETLAAACRFRDCGHRAEHGCAVLAAVEQGELSEERLNSYRKLGRELLHIEAQTDGALAREQKRTFKILNKSMKQFKKR